MIFSLFLYFFLIKTILLIENNKTLKDGFYEIFNEYVKQFNLSELNLSKECLFKEKYYPDLNKTYLYYKKLALDSSKSLNDISTYDECMNNRHKIQNNTSNFSYVLIYIDKRFTKKLNLSYEHTYLLAMCMVNNINCKKDDYKKLFLFFYNKYLENLTQEDRISIFFLDKTTDIFKYNFISFEQIPFYIFSSAYQSARSRPLPSGWYAHGWAAWFPRKSGNQWKRSSFLPGIVSLYRAISFLHNREEKNPPYAKRFCLLPQ